MISHALEAFRDEVASGAFPSKAFSPYKMSAEEQLVLSQRLADEGFTDAAFAVTMAGKHKDSAN